MSLKKSSDNLGNAYPGFLNQEYSPPIRIYSAQARISNLYSMNSFISFTFSAEDLGSFSSLFLYIEYNLMYMFLEKPI